MLESGCLFFSSFHQPVRQLFFLDSCLSSVDFETIIIFVSFVQHITSADGVVCLKMLNTDKAFILYCPSILLFDKLRFSQKHITSTLFAGHTKSVLLL
jgi:hypothetical protein